MKYLLQLCLILTLLLSGNIISSVIEPVIEIPGAIIGMMLLLLFLLLGVIKENDIRETCDFFLNNLVFFFIPASVGIVAHFDLIKDDILIIILVIVSSVFISVSVTALIIQTFLKEKKE